MSDSRQIALHWMQASTSRDEVTKDTAVLVWVRSYARWNFKTVGMQGVGYRAEYA